MAEQESDLKEGAEESGSFGVFITGLSMQALLFMGEMPNPVNNKKEINLPNAKYVIDTIAMIKAKTKGNLTAEEANLLEDLLYQLRLKYLELFKKQSQ